MLSLNDEVDEKRDRKREEESEILNEKEMRCQRIINNESKLSLACTVLNIF